MKIKYIILFILIPLSTIFARDLVRADILISDWKFEIGDNPEWSDPEFDDSNWEKINVPGTWESNGFPGYDGYAWYRVKFKLKEAEENTIYYLKLGMIDDCDITYLNGHLIGFQGSFPPNYVTAFQSARQYIIPKKFLNLKGANVISVRVYDHEGQGGIKWGDVGLYKKYSNISPIIDLSGMWKFKQGDDLQWKERQFDDSDWREIFVPGIWQFQGYQDYIGYAWYRIEFDLTEKWQKENLILIPGKIDDIDQTYINGKLVGKTGYMPPDAITIETNNSDWQNLVIHEISHIDTCRFCNNKHHISFWRRYEELMRKFLPDKALDKRYNEDVGYFSVSYA